VKGSVEGHGFVKGLVRVTLGIAQCRACEGRSAHLVLLLRESKRGSSL